MGEGRGEEEGRGGSITLLMLHMWRRNPATPRLQAIPRSFELRAHVYASFAHASAHPDIRTVRGLLGT